MQAGQACVQNSAEFVGKDEGDKAQNDQAAGALRRHASGDSESKRG